MSLHDILRSQEVDRVFILGMAKNAGKTFTLNHLVRSASRQGERLGLTSTGRDGEPLDLVTGKAKPSIFCPRGTLVASARLALDASSASFVNEEAMGIDTPLGEVSIAEVSGEGNVELAGPLFAGELECLLERMEERGARRAFVDGSLDRRAAGRVVEDLILAVGAVVSRRLDEIVEAATSLVEQLRAPPPPEHVLEALEGRASGCSFFREDGSREALPFSSMLGRSRELARVLDDESPFAIYVAGAVGEDSFATLARRDSPVRLVIRNAASLFARPSDWRSFVGKGGVCYAVQPLRLLAVTVNPYSPEGWEFPPDEFKFALEEALAPVPVINPAIYD